MDERAATHIARPKMKPAMTTWLEDIVEFESRAIPGGKLLIYTLSNGQRFAIPLTGKVLKLTQQAVSPVTIATSLPNNGHQAL